MSPGRCPRGGALRRCPRALGHAWVCLGTRLAQPEGSRAGWGCAQGGSDSHPNVSSAHSSVPLMPPRPPHHQWHPRVAAAASQTPWIWVPTPRQGPRGRGDSYPCPEPCCPQGEAEHPRKVSLLTDAKHRASKIPWHLQLVSSTRTTPFLGRELGRAGDKEQQNKHQHPVQDTRTHARGFAPRDTEEPFVL